MLGFVAPRRPTQRQSLLVVSFESAVFAHAIANSSPQSFHEAELHCEVKMVSLGDEENVSTKLPTATLQVILTILYPGRSAKIVAILVGR